MIGRTRALQWLENISYCWNVSIEHKYNTEKIRFGQHNLPVDGFQRENYTVYQFICVAKSLYLYFKKKHQILFS